MVRCGGSYYTVSVSSMPLPTVGESMGAVDGILLMTSVLWICRLVGGYASS